MEFLAMLVALAILELRGSGAPLQQDRWFLGYRARLSARLQGAARQAALILVPVVAVLLVQGAVAGRLYGLAELVLFVLVLLYALGRGNLASALTDYLQPWSRGDFQAAFQQFSAGSAADLSQDDAVAHPRALHDMARRRLYQRSFDRSFAVLFWFFLLGPAGALAYRLAALEQEAARRDADPGDATEMLRRIEWLPARLSGISFALVGHFDACLYAWQRVLGEPRMATIDALESCGNAALDFAVPAGDESAEQLVARGSRELHAIENLHRRALLVWLVIMAALAMIF